MTKPSKREENRQEMRAAFLEAARAAFVRDGFDGVSMRKLATEVGYSHGSIYLHFKNKEQLFDCLVEESFAQLAQSFRSLKSAHTTLDPVRQLKKAGRVYVEFGLLNPSAYEFAFILRRPGKPRRWKPHLAYQYLRELVKECLAKGRIRATSVDAASQAVWAAAHGVTCLLILRPWFPWVDRDKLIRTVIDSAVDGMISAR